MYVYICAQKVDMILWVVHTSPLVFVKEQFIAGLSVQLGFETSNAINMSLLSITCPVLGFTHSDVLENSMGLITRHMIEKHT